jgi:hypothetical protein
MWALLRIGAGLAVLSAGGASGGAPGAPPPAAGAVTPPAGEHKFRKVKTGNAEGVVVPAAPGDKKAWTPDDGSVRSFEEGLAAYLQKKRPPEEPDLHLKLDQYKRQYVGKVEGKRRTLFVIFSCRPAPDWEDAVRITKDGGSCHFEITYDPAKHTYTDLHVHHQS